MLRYVVHRIGLFEASAAQPGGQFGVVVLPGQFQHREGFGPPERLVFQQEGVQSQEALEQVGAGQGSVVREHGAKREKATGRAL